MMARDEESHGGGGSVPLLSSATTKNGLLEKSEKFHDLPDTNGNEVGVPSFNDDDDDDDEDEDEIPPMTRVRRRLHTIPPIGYIVIASLAGILAIYISFALGRRYETKRTYVSTHAAGLSGDLVGTRNSIVFSNGTEWLRDPSLKIVAIIFYGRRQFVDILDCYLRRMLAVNGGLVDEVQFIIHTDVDEDIDYLRNMIKASGLGDSYRIVEEDTKSLGWSQWGTYSTLYRDHMSDPSTIYLKIDDDVMFIDDYVVSEVIRTTLEHPEAHSVLANIINNKRSHWYHHRMDAVWPYLPDFDRSGMWKLDSWKPSELPTFPENQIPPKGKVFFPGYPAPFPGHRWLPMSPSSSSPNASLLERTPYSNHIPDPTYELSGPGVGWSVAAQAHYSLFENLERGLLRKYYFGNGIDHSFNLRYTRYNINFLAIRGSHIAMRPLWGDANGGHIDEELLTEIIPRELEMPALIATRAIVSHYSFQGDRPELLKTDLLDRYRAYANERVCEPSNRKKSFADKKSDTHHILEASEEADPGDGPGDMEHIYQEQADVHDAPPPRW